MASNPAPRKCVMRRLAYHPLMTDLVPALCSVTFRALGPERIIELAQAAGCRAIEWGGDVHVPPGAETVARDIKAQTLQAGLELGSYGSYLVAGSPQGLRGATAPDVETLIDTTRALGAPALRVWAGKQASRSADSWTRETVAAALVEIAAKAQEHQLAVSLEFHVGTLTDDANSARDLLERTGASNLFTHWQPRPGLPIDEALREIDTLAGYLSYLHVFAWDGDANRHPLASATEYWCAVFEAFESAAAPGWPGPRTACLEFVRGDEPEQFERDAATLAELLA